MRFGPRRPSPIKSLKAKTLGSMTREAKRTFIPWYGKKGYGWLHPKRKVRNEVYKRTTFGIKDLLKLFK